MRVIDLHEWIGTEVLDVDGEPVGKLEEVFFAGDDAVLVDVKRGRLRATRHLVPLREASVSREHVHLPFPGDRLLEWGGGTPDAHQVGEHYGQGYRLAGSAELEASRDRESRRRELEEARNRVSEAEAEAERARADREAAERRNADRV